MTTLALCLKGSDGIALVSDSRGTFGDPRGITAQNDNMKKVYDVSRYVGVLFAGSGEIGAMVFQEITQSLSNSPIEGVTPILELIRELLITKYDEWFPGFLIRPIQGSETPVRPGLAVIIGGYEVIAGEIPTQQKIYSLNSLNNFAPMLHDYGFALQGIAQYALYLLNRLYVQEMPVDTLLRLGAYVITETASQDGKVGGPVQALKIMPQEGCYLLSEDDINTINETNNTRRNDLRSLFGG